MSSQAIPLNTEYPAEKKPNRPIARDVLETAGHLSGVAGLYDATTRVGNVVDVVDRSIATGAKKAAGVAAKWGWKKLAAFCLKIAAASTLIAKIVVAVAVVAVTVCIFQVVRSA